MYRGDLFGVYEFPSPRYLNPIRITLKFFYGIIVIHNKDFIYIYIYFFFFFLFSSLQSRFYLEGSSFSWLVLKKLALKLHQLNCEAVGFCESGQFFELFRKAKTE